MSLDFKNSEDALSVLHAFRQLYIENKSYNNISINQIADRSGIHVGHIHALFEGKDDIAINIIKKDIYDIFMTYDEEVDQSIPVSDRLKIFMSLQFEFLGPDYKLIKELIPHAAIPLTPFFSLANETRKRYLNFVSELFRENLNKTNTLIKMVTIPAIANSFLAFNLTVLRFWENDKSDGKQDTLNYIDKGLKNIMVVSAMF